LSAALVQLFSSEPPHHTSWVQREFGVLCLVKDNIRRSYFFRLYCLTRNILVWEHEVYLHIDYRSPRPFLHTFEAEVNLFAPVRSLEKVLILSANFFQDGITAFNFADEDEAVKLRLALLQKMEAKKQKKIG
jgi:neural Wiskott-Aldrich syndrome protein